MGMRVVLNCFVKVVESLRHLLVLLPHLILHVFLMILSQAGFRPPKTGTPKLRMTESANICKHLQAPSGPLEASPPIYWDIIGIFYEYMLTNLEVNAWVLKISPPSLGSERAAALRTSSARAVPSSRFSLLSCVR
jgi:hypothetical protein